jgi:hypothetical protein
LLLPALVVATFLIAAHARAQIAGQVGGTPASTPAPATQFFSNPEVHLTYEYPAELKAQDGAFAAAIARRMIYGEDAETDYAKARDCAKVLLSVGTGREGSPGPWVRVALVEIGELCAPAKVLQNKKAAQALLANLVKQGTTVMGMMPVERPTVYQIQGHWAAFCAAQGTPVTGQDLQTGQEQLIGVAAVAVDAKILGWVIQTSDAATFNRLLATGVDFGTGKPERLFAGAVQ